MTVRNWHQALISAVFPGVGTPWIFGESVPHGFLNLGPYYVLLRTHLSFRCLLHAGTLNLTDRLFCVVIVIFYDCSTTFTYLNKLFISRVCKWYFSVQAMARCLLDASFFRVSCVWQSAGCLARCVYNWVSPNKRGTAAFLCLFNLRKN